MTFNQNQQAYFEIKREQKNRRYIKRLVLALCILLVFVSLYFLTDPPTSVSFTKVLLSLAVFLLGFVPAFEYLLNQNRPPIPFLPLVGLFYSTSFGLPMLAADTELSGGWSFSEVSEYSLLLTLLGLTLMLFFFYGTKLFIWNKVSHVSIPINQYNNQLLRTAWLFLILYLSYLYVPIVKSLPTVSQLIKPLIYISYGLFYILWLDKRLGKINFWLLGFIFLPLSLAPLLASGSLAQLMLVCLFMLIVIWQTNQRIPFFLIAITLSLYLFLSPVKHQYRYQAWSPSADLTVLEKVELFWDLAVQHHTSDVNKSEGNSRIISRSAHILLLSDVIDDTPERVPFWDGKTYLPLFSKFIPRALWPNKPLETTGNEFGRRYSYLGSSDYTTSFNLPIIVELYANFGDMGILLGMSILGMILAYLDKKFNGLSMNSIEFLVGASLLFSLVYQESNFSLLFGNIVILSIGLIILFRILLKSSSIKYGS